tara:strand:- start:2115 stop:3866 length:1752 start_codon:yes stop_codon:yes gene_type:complete
MVNFDLRLVGVTAVSLLGLYAMNRPKPFTPYDDDQSKRPRRPNRRPRDPLRPRRPISAESFEADHPEHKGKVRTMSGKPHTPRELKKDKDITPEEAAKRLELSSESFTPPQSAVNNAKRGLELRKKYGRGGLSPAEAKSQGIDSGVTRARKIASGKVSRHDVRRMSAFNRHRGNYNPSKKMPDGGPTAGTIAWLLWGGSSGVDWAKKKSAAMGAESFEVESERGVDWEGKPYTGKIYPDDPDLDEQKADRNKDGKLSSWERAVGNQVARGIREGGYGSEFFNADFEDDDDYDDDKPTDWRIDKLHHEMFVDRSCSMCDRPYDYSKLSRALVNHYLNESDGNTMEWKSKSNPDGVRRTARNIAGWEILNYGLDALEHYMLNEAKETVVSEQVILLLRKAIVPQIIVGDVTEFIKLLEIDDVEETEPKFGDDFWETWESEDYLSTAFNSEGGDGHDEVDALIKRLDDLNQFAITFMHDGGYGGEPISTDIDGDGMKTEIIGFVEDSIRIKIISDTVNDEILGIRISYTDSPKGPVIYLPPAQYIATRPDEIDHDHDHDHDHDDHDHDHHEEEDEFIKKLHKDSYR